jgi:hypothetical protein
LLRLIWPFGAGRPLQAEHVQPPITRTSSEDAAATARSQPVVSVLGPTTRLQRLYLNWEPREEEDYGSSA